MVPPEKYYAANLHSLLPWLETDTGIFSTQELRDIVSCMFKADAKADEENRALLALRTLIKQTKMQLCCSIAKTRGIRVEAWSSHVSEHPLQREKEYMFLYRVRFENIGSKKVQLTGRHFKIIDAADDHVEIPRNSPGVVGHTPILRPGDCFEYASGTNLKTSTGLMEGSFQMEEISESGEREPFDALLSPFKLLGPRHIL